MKLENVKFAMFKNLKFTLRVKGPVQARSRVEGRPKSITFEELLFGR